MISIYKLSESIVINNDNEPKSFQIYHHYTDNIAIVNNSATQMGIKIQIIIS